MPRKFVIYDRTNRPKLEYPKNTENYIDYQVHQVKKSTGSGIDDFEINEEVEEIKTNIDEFINSFKDDVGIDNILKRIALTGDQSLLNQKEAVFMDTTIIPEDPEEAFNKANSVQEAFEAIDSDLKGTNSLEDFVKNLSDEKIKEYIDRKIKELEEEKKNEGNK